MPEMMDTEMVADFLHVSARHFSERIAVQPDFPKASRLPSAGGRGKRLWFSDEIRAWIKKQR